MAKTERAPTIERPGGILEQSPDMDTLGGRLSRAREATGMTTAQLARRIGVRTATLQSWETDRSEPRANRLTMLAGVLNVSLSWLLHGVGPAPQEENRSEASRHLHNHLEQMRMLRDRVNAIVEKLEADLRRLGD